MNESLNSGTSTAPARKSVVILVVLFLVAGVGIAYYLHKPAAPAVAASDSEPQTTAAEPAEKPQPTPIAERPAPVKASTAASATAHVTPNAAPSLDPSVSPQVRQIVTALAGLNMTNGPLTPEKLAAWRSTIQMLTNQGPAALPAIREFLKNGQDMNFDSVGGAKEMGQSSLRLALLDAAFAVGGAEANSIAADAMRSSTDPREIAIIARNLEQLAPGEFSQAALDAARAALAQARDGKAGNVDVGALFDVLQRFGGADAVRDFQNAQGPYTWYSTIALGQLPDGAGIPALKEMAQSDNAHLRGAALPMIAEWTTASADARQIVLSQAQAGLDPSTWIRVSQVLGGEFYGIGSDGNNGIPAVVDRKPNSTHLQQGNQNFYTISAVEGWNVNQINQNLELLNQLQPYATTDLAKKSIDRARQGLQAQLQRLGGS